MHKIAIIRPITTIMFALALLFFGYGQIQTLPTEYLPNVDYPVITVSTTYKGASSEIIESKVTDKIEEAISGISGLDSVSSSTSKGASIVVAQFKLSKSSEEAANDVRDKVSSIYLPGEVDKPIIEKFSMSSAPIITLFLASEANNTQKLTTYADEIIKPKLQKIKGVGKVNIVGLRKRVIRITPDITALAKYNMTIDELSSKISEENIKRDGGKIVQTKNELSVSIDADAVSIQGLKNIKIKDGVMLSDVASVTDDVVDERTYANLNTESGVLLQIQKISGANEVEIAKVVKEQIPALQNLSKEFRLSTLFDTTTFTEATLKSVQFDLLLGCILASFVVFIFLRNSALTLVASLSLPISIFGVFAIMGWSGQTFNLLTLTALTLAIGIIIDDAIVVIENIYKKLELGLSKFQAAKEGVGEISFSVLAISAMLLAVFVPIANMSGIVGRFFTSFGITVVAAICVSYIVAVTLIPMISSLIANQKQSSFYIKTEPIFVALEQSYKQALIKAIKYKKTTLIGALVIFVASIVLSGNLGMVFVPKEDRSQFKITLKTDANISMGEMKRNSLEVQKTMLAIPEVDYSSLSVGLNGNLYEGAIFVRLKPMNERAKSQQEIIDYMRNKSKIFKNMEININEADDVGGGEMTTPFQMILKASDAKIAEASATKLMEYLKSVSGTTNIQSNMQLKKPEISIEILSENTARYGVKSSDLADVIAMAYSGETSISFYRQDGKEYDILMRLSDAMRDDPSAIGNLTVRNDKGQTIFVSALIKMSQKQSPTTIKRYDRQKDVLIGCDLGNDLALDALLSKVEANKDKWLINGVSYQLEGDAKNMVESNEAFSAALFAALVMIYLILASLYESPLQPIVIMSAMPLSFTGAFLGLYLAGMDMSLFSMMGLMLLLGLVGKNSTLVVDAANRFRQEGISLNEAIIEAGTSRLRPILMTTVAMCLGMLPLAISTGEGSGLKAPMGVSVISGLLVSTMLSLFVVPALYKLIAPLDDKLRKLYKHDSMR